MKNEFTKTEQYRYLFYYEDEGEEGYHFEIEAKDHEEAFDKAYESYGPQVENMYYRQCII